MGDPVDQRLQHVADLLRMRDEMVKELFQHADGAVVRLMNLGIAYDSGFQNSSNVSPALPSNWAWRVGAGAQHQVSKSFT